MREEESRTELSGGQETRPTDHPWVDLPLEDDSLGEAVRYSLDEIRYA